MQSSDTGRTDPAQTHPSASWTKSPRLWPTQSKYAPEFAEAMRHPAYPRASAYNAAWTFENAMGPVPTWLAEELASAMNLKPGQRILDLGCGGAITSIFLAREFGVEVWAADLWIEPQENAARIDEAGVSDKAFPLTAEAHRLPFAHEYFDAVVSIDAFHYFGTEVRYLSYLAQFVKTGGRIGIVVPANSVDPDDPGALALPDELSDGIGADWFTFRSAEWWRRHWSRTACVDVETAGMIERGRDTWLRSRAATRAWSPRAAEHDGDDALLGCDAGKTLGFCKIVARRNEQPGLSFGPAAFEHRIA